MKAKLLRFLIPFFLLNCVVTYVVAMDCTSAEGKIEKSICSDSYLQKLAEMLVRASSYAEQYIRMKMSDSDEIDIQFKIHQELDVWLSQRNSCKTKACLVTAYESRILEFACIETGAGSGANYCSFTKVRFAEHELTELEERLVPIISEKTVTPEYTERLMRAELKSWYAYRSANCELEGASTGGDAQWMYAAAEDCNLRETIERITRAKKQLE